MNAQSLNNKAGEFADFVCKYKPDVVAIMETWFHEIESASHTLCTSPGYSLLVHPWSNCTGGGTGVLFIDTLNVTKIAAVEFQPFEYSEWNIKSESEQIHLIIIYRFYHSPPLFLALISVRTPSHMTLKAFLNAIVLHSCQSLTTPCTFDH